jgi:hypothetical protein
MQCGSLDVYLFFFTYCLVYMNQQMLFYESAKALHGRMTKLKGKYYASIFIHYQPVDKFIWNYQHEVCG